MHTFGRLFMGSDCYVSDSDSDSVRIWFRFRFHIRFGYAVFFFLPLAFRFRCIPACGNVSRPSWRMRNAAAQLHFLPHFARILRNVHSRARRSDRQRITVTGTFWEHRLGFGMCALAVVVRWNSCWYAALIGSPRALSFINTISQPDLKNRATCAMSTISVECPYLGIKFTTHYQRKKKQKKLGRKKRKKKQPKYNRTQRSMNRKQVLLLIESPVHRRSDIRAV